MQGDLGLIVGDLNTTLDPKWDRYGYTQDSHKKSRAVITSWLATEELVDAMRFHHPEGPLYSWKTPKGDKDANSGVVSVVHSTTRKDVLITFW